MESSITMDIFVDILSLLIFPCGLFLLILGLVYEWVDRKLLAQLQNRIGPRWFQPLADVLNSRGSQPMVIYWAAYCRSCRQSYRSPLYTHYRPSLHSQLSWGSHRYGLPA
jgi:hypothetical protein